MRQTDLAFFAFKREQEELLKTLQALDMEKMWIVPTTVQLLFLHPYKYYVLQEIKKPDQKLHYKDSLVFLQ